MKDKKEEVKRRCTTATRLRSQKMLDLITHLCEVGTMLRDDIFDYLFMSPSGGRKYVHDLRFHKVLVLERFVDATPTYLGHPLYRLNQNEDIVANFIRSLETAPRAGTKQNTSPKVSEIDPTRHQYSMGHDGECLFKQFQAPPPDPLLAQFFGLGRVTP